MGYKKQNFTDGQVLTAAQLNHIEDGILNTEESVVSLTERVSELDSKVNNAILSATVE